MYSPEAEAETGLDIESRPGMRDTSLSEYLGAKVSSGFDMTTTNLVRTELQMNDRPLPLVGEALPVFEETPEYKALTKEEYEASPYFREGIRWFEGMSEKRAQVYAENFDERRYRDSLIERSPTGARSVLGFGASLLGNIVDPVNFIPFLGPAAKAAFVGRAGLVAGRALAGAVEAAIGTAAVDTALIPWMQAQGEDFGWVDAATDVLFGAIIGGGLGAGGGLLERRSLARIRATVEERGKIARALEDTLLRDGEADIEGILGRDTAERLRSKSIPPVVSEVRDRVSATLEANPNFTTEQADALLTVLDARAHSWAESYKKTPEEWYSTYLADVRTGKAEDLTAGSLSDPLGQDSALFQRREWKVVGAPSQSIKAYKLFELRKGELHPLFVDRDLVVPIGEWIQAEPGESTPAGKVKSKLGPLAYRPGWHSGDMPVATHIGSGGQPPKYRPANQVWAEVEVSDDVDWQGEANNRARKSKKTGEIVPVTAHITDQVPLGGHYRYKTNPNMTGNWIISGEMKINRILSDAETAEINAKFGVSDLPREPNILEHGGPTSKGAIQFLDDSRAVIHLFETADVSTVIHETGHLLRRQLSEADTAVIERAFGVNEGAWNTEQEEAFARAFEAYFHEGIAPSKPLEGVFAKIKGWMQGIYWSIRELGGPINPEVRDVFDRALTTEEQRLDRFRRPREIEIPERPGPESTPEEYRVHPDEEEHIQRLRDAGLVDAEDARAFDQSNRLIEQTDKYEAGIYAAITCV